MTMKPTRHIVMDIETLGTESNAIVLSVGMVRIMYDTFLAQYVVPALGSSNARYAVFNASSQIKTGRTVSSDTVRWWGNQSLDVQDVILKSMLYMENLEITLLGIRDWMRDSPEPCRVWGKGPNFDNKIMDNLITQVFGQNDFWKFRNDRCLRTMGDFGIQYDAENQRPHHALYDAHHEAGELVAATNHLKSLGLDPLAYY